MLHTGGHFATCGTTASCMYRAAVYPTGGLTGGLTNPVVALSAGSCARCRISLYMVYVNPVRVLCGLYVWSHI